MLQMEYHQRFSNMRGLN